MRRGCTSLVAFVIGQKECQGNDVFSMLFGRDHNDVVDARMCGLHKPFLLGHGVNSQSSINRDTYLVPDGQPRDCTCATC